MLRMLLISHVCICCNLILGSAFQNAVAQEPAPKSTERFQQHVEKLIEQLGADSFSERQKAMRTLGKLGIPALPALRNAATVNDDEVQQRVLILLEGIEKLEQDRMLAEFIAHPEKPVTLAGWQGYLELVPDSTESRKLFAQMHRNERKLLKMWEENSRDLQSSYQMRCTEIQQSLSFKQRRTVSLGTVSTLLLIGGEPTLNMPVQAIYSVYSFVYSQKSVLSQSQGATGKILRTILGHWIGRPGQDGAYQRMLLAMQHGIPEGTKPAMAMIENGAINSQMQYAFFAIAKLGTQEHIPFLLKYANDKRAILKVPGGKGRVQYSIEFRDLALVGLAQLTKQDVRSYFSTIQKNTTYLYNPNSARFATDKDREAAFKKWNDWVAKNPEAIPQLKKKKPVAALRPA